MRPYGWLAREHNAGRGTNPDSQEAPPSVWGPKWGASGASVSTCELANQALYWASYRSINLGATAKGSGLSSFAHAIVLFSSSAQSQIQAALKRWSTQDDLGREIVRNLNPLERFLPPDAMKVLLDAIRKAHKLTVDQLILGYRDACYTQTMRGGSIKCVPPTLVGRAVEKDIFVWFLFRSERKFFKIKANASDLVDRLLIGDKLTPKETGILMSQFAAWVTWNDKGSADPFDFAADAFHVRACLGLDNKRRVDKPLLLLVYSLAAGLSLVRPTVADAGLHSFFEPPPIGIDEHGWTKTWPAKLARTKTKAKPIPRPEAIHSPVPLAYLKSPARLL